MARSVFCRIAHMIAQFLFVASVLAVVLVGLLLITQVLSLEQLGHGISRCLWLIALAFAVVCLLRAVLLPILLCLLVWWKGVMLWALGIVLAMIALLLLPRMLLMKFGNRKTRTQHQPEEL